MNTSTQLVKGSKVVATVVSADYNVEVLPPKDGYDQQFCHNITLSIEGQEYPCQACTSLSTQRDYIPGAQVRVIVNAFRYGRYAIKFVEIVSAGQVNGHTSPISATTPTPIPAAALVPVAKNQAEQEGYKVTTGLPLDYIPKDIAVELAIQYYAKQPIPKLKDVLDTARTLYASGNQGVIIPAPVSLARSIGLAMQFNNRKGTRPIEKVLEFAQEIYDYCNE